MFFLKKRKERDHVTGTFCYRMNFKLFSSVLVVISCWRVSVESPVSPDWQPSSSSNREREHQASAAGLASSRSAWLSGAGAAWHWAALTGFQNGKTHCRRDARSQPGLRGCPAEAATLKSGEGGTVQGRFHIFINLQTGRDVSGLFAVSSCHFWHAEWLMAFIS